MTANIPLWAYLEQVAKAKEPARKPALATSNDYLADQRPRYIVDWTGRKIKKEEHHG